MKTAMRFWVFMLLSGVALTGFRALAAEFSPTLDYELTQAGTQNFVSAIVILESPLDIRAIDMRLHLEKASKARRHKEVLDALHYNVDQTQPKFRAEFDDAVKRGDMQGYTAYWIENCFVIYAKVELIESLRSRGDVKYVTENFTAQLIEPVHREAAGARNPLLTRTLPIGIDAVGARRVVEELGLTGAGVIIGDNDTGVDGTHPALSSRWRGLHAPWWQCWLDNTNAGTMTPTDFNGHGTHTMGTMTGMEINGTDTTWIGCAPGAEWIANDVISISVGQNLNNEILRSFQWFTDPDTVNHDPEAVPDVLNNSWGVGPRVGYVQCFDMWNTAVMNCEAGGTVVVFAAGNERVMGPGSLRSPATYEFTETQMFSVGADSLTNAAWPYPLSYFSSIGPAMCNPSPDAVKPEVVAPGSDVYSSWPGGYEIASGTSMASPHVSGVVALMREACPSCDPITIKQALINTAHDEGDPGQDNMYGYGFIDAYAAVNAVASMGRIVGTVRDAQNNPLAGVTVRNTNGPQEFRTNASGHYQMPLAEGTYTLAFSKFAYNSQTVSNLVVVTGDSTVSNVTLSLAPTGLVSGHVTNCLSMPGVGAVVRLVGVPVDPDTANASGFYSISAPQGLYDMEATVGGCGTATAQGVVIGNSTTQDFTLPPDPRFVCSDPDAGGYVACENGDPNGPAYDWLEISPNAGGLGLLTGIVGEDESQVFPLPFTFHFYGAAFNEVHICSNGFLSFDATNADYFNMQLPVPALGYAIVPYWCDLSVPHGGDISYYYIPTQNAYVIEWRAIPRFDGTSPVTCQVWLYEATSPNGNSRIRIQYQTVLDATNCTVGLQDGLNASRYSSNGVFDPHAQGLASGRVITYGGTGCQGSPQISVTPSQINEFVPLGGQRSDTLHICNVGPCPLNYTLSFLQVTPTSGTSSELNDNHSAEHNLDASGGPDTYGNVWMDSNEPNGPSFHWIELAGLGSNTGITGNDQAINFPMGWPFNFYGTNYNSVWICSNGFLQFGPTPSTAYANTILPNPGAPRNMVAPFWDDLFPVAGLTTVYYYDDPANYRFVVEYSHMGHYGPFTPGDYTFEVILYSNGDILFQYLTMTGTLTSATIGIQNQTGTDGLQIEYNQNYVAANLATRITGPHPYAPWMAFASPTTGSLDPAACANIALRFNAGTLPEGQYNGNIIVANNDPLHNPVNVPVIFRVGVLQAPGGFTIAYVPGTNQLSFRWLSTGAPLYRVFSSTTPNGAFNTLIGSTSGTSLQVALPDAPATRLYYIVESTDGASNSIQPPESRSAPESR